jgi:hypothetical protein
MCVFRLPLQDRHQPISGGFNGPVQDKAERPSSAGGVLAEYVPADRGVIACAPCVIVTVAVGRRTAAKIGEGDDLDENNLAVRFRWRGPPRPSCLETLW